MVRHVTQEERLGRKLPGQFRTPQPKLGLAVPRAQETRLGKNLDQDDQRVSASITKLSI